MINRKMLVIILTAIVLMGWFQTAGAASYFKGKTITVLVGFSAGGGTDTVARTLARHLGKHIPGNPSVIVKNMVGAGGIKAMNFLYASAKPDGLTILWQTWTPIAQLVKAPGVRFDYGKLTLIGGAVTAPFVAFARTGVIPGGLKEPKDLIKAKEPIYAGYFPNSVLDLHGRLSLDLLLDGKFRYVPGYRGGAKARAAIKGKQADIASHGLAGYRSGVEPTMVKDGTVIPLWYWAKKDEKGNFIGSPHIQDMPSFQEVYKQAHGKAPSGQYWDAMNFLLTLFGELTNCFWGPPDMDKEAAAELSEGFYKMMTDEATIADMTKIMGFPYDPVPLQAAKEVVRNFSKSDAEMVEFFRTYIEAASK